MNHQTLQQPTQVSQYTIKNFLPLIIIGALILFFTITRQFVGGWNLQNAMYDFMGSFFLVFGFFKALNLKGFAEAYASYDIIAKRSMGYAYAYPFIELSLGVLYLLKVPWMLLPLFTFILMVISSIGVAKELAKNQPIMCACLGTVFKIPMTYVTLGEDILMALMALVMMFY